MENCPECDELMMITLANWKNATLSCPNCGHIEIIYATIPKPNYNFDPNNISLIIARPDIVDPDEFNLETLIHLVETKKINIDQIPEPERSEVKKHIGSTNE